MLTFVHYSPHWGCLFNQLCVNHPATLCHPAHVSPSVYGKARSRALACILYFCSVTTAGVICPMVSGATVGRGHGLLFSCRLRRQACERHVVNAGMTDFVSHTLHQCACVLIYACSEPITCFFVHKYLICQVCEKNLNLI